MNIPWKELFELSGFIIMAWWCYRFLCMIDDVRKIRKMMEEEKVKEKK
jgi:hypothetical protein